MSKLLRHIEKSNEPFIEKIISIIIDDEEWIEALGITEDDLKKTEITAAIRNQLLNTEKAQAIESLLAYIISDHILDDTKIPLITHHVSAEVYTQTSALFVFKCSNLYFCHSIGFETTSIITKDPEDFCRTAAKTIIDYFELEKENLSDEWFEDSDVTNELTVNFDFTNIQQNP
jgi:hypothetical protein